MNECVICESTDVSEATHVEHFQYGPDGDVILSASVIVLTCPSCEFSWTDHRGATARQEAVEKHLSSTGIYLCTICRSVPVDVAQGFDTCGSCLEGV